MYIKKILLFFLYCLFFYWKNSNITNIYLENVAPLFPGLHRYCREINIFCRVRVSGAGSQGSCMGGTDGTSMMVQVL